MVVYLLQFIISRGERFRSDQVILSIGIGIRSWEIATDDDSENDPIKGTIFSCLAGEIVVFIITVEAFCDDQVPACGHCRRFAFLCLVEDPVTKRRQPRNYLETLEYRVGFLERILKEARPDLADDHLFQGDFHRPETQSSPFAVVKSINNQYGGRSTSIRAGGESDGLDDLASKVGMLSMNAAGAEPHYLGSSSTFAFSRLINPTLRQAVLRKDTGMNAFRQHQDDSSMLPTPCPLPDYETAVKLSNAYFENIHSQYPFLHEPTFRVWEAMLNGTSESLDALNFNPIPLFFLNIVYAVGALILPSSGYSAERLYISAQLYIDHILQLENLEAIQAILGCAVYSLRSPIGTSHWKLAGLALRQCIDLGYHRNSRRLRTMANPLQLELRKRVFWCAYAIDCMAAIMLGRPLGIPCQEFDAEYPMDIDDSCITNETIRGTPRSSSSDPPTSMTRAIHAFRFRLILSNIHTSLYSDIIHPNPANHFHHIEHLRSKIEDWRASTPPLKPLMGEELSLFVTAESFDMDYNYSILQLYRLQIIDSTGGATDGIFLECMRAAESLCHSYRRQFFKKPTTYTWAALHELFLAGLTYLHCLWTSPAARGATQQHLVSNTCTDCTIVLVLMAERWVTAAPYRDIFEALSRHTMSMMANKSDEQSTLPSVLTQHDNPDAGHLAQWIACIADEGMSEGYNGLLTSWVDDLPLQEQNSEAGWSWDDNDAGYPSDLSWK
ncbi:hypothetical protein B7463_g8032, partial [Scytalidium lignicola]